MGVVAEITTVNIFMREIGFAKRAEMDGPGWPCRWGQGSNFDVAPDAAVATASCGCYLF